jgi:fructose-1,6-bisphosphatase I
MTEQTLSIQTNDTDHITLTRWILGGLMTNKEATGEFTYILSSIQLACKVVATAVRKAGIANLTGLAGTDNVQGEAVKKLDILANDTFINALRASKVVSVMVSEENEEPIILDEVHCGKYVVTFDPLDGSSNIDCGVSIGSIFGIWEQLSPGTRGTKEDALQSGRHMVAAGYCLYGSFTQLILSIRKDSVNGFTLDPTLGEFILTHPHIQIPARGAIYSINEGNQSVWLDDEIRQYVKQKNDPKDGAKPYSSRYVGSMVADVHRTLLYGGIFIYPADKKSKSGKLRILYEGFPMAYLLEAAGGRASTGRGDILDVVPTNIHMRTPIILGSPDDVNDLLALYNKPK